MDKHFFDQTEQKLNRILQRQLANSVITGLKCLTCDLNWKNEQMHFFLLKLRGREAILSPAKKNIQLRWKSQNIGWVQSKHRTNETWFFQSFFLWKILITKRAKKICSKKTCVRKTEKCNQQQPFEISWYLPNTEQLWKITWKTCHFIRNYGVNIFIGVHKFTVRNS